MTNTSAISWSSCDPVSPLPVLDILLSPPDPGVVLCSSGVLESGVESKSKTETSLPEVVSDADITSAALT